VEGGAGGDAVEPTELIESQTQGDQDFEIQAGYRLRRGGGDFIV
jgi:hypothetical protein